MTSISNVATKRNEVVVTYNSDYLILHGALFRLASDHRIHTIHAGILILPQESMTILVGVTQLAKIFLVEQASACRMLAG